MEATERRALFCATLKSARQQHGVPLEQIAASTKISAALLHGLEGNDLSRWPKGLFRRSYLRDYLRAVGLPSEPMLAEFVRLFPDEDQPANGNGAASGDSDRPLLMALGDNREERRALTRRRVLATAIDAFIVVGVSFGASWVTPDAFWTIGALVALGYYSTATVALGHSLGAHWVADRSSRRWKRAGALIPAAPGGDKTHRFRGLRRRLIRATSRDLARVPWSALLRIRFLR